MSNLALQVVSFEDKEIRITPDQRISVYDVLVAFTGQSIKAIHKSWYRINQQHPEVEALCQYYKFPGQGQRETPVATQEAIFEILKIFGCHPDQKWVMSDKFYPRTESQIILVLSAAFQDCEPCRQFFCEGYRIDLYLAKPRIAIEIDENGHHDYCSKKEKTREKAIKKALGCSFVRFDPYANDFNIGNVIFQVRKYI